jgi:hypothetical protein
MYYRACCASLSVLLLASPGLAFLRYAFLLRLEDRGRPSVVCPFSGSNVHWTFVLIRFTLPPPLTGPLFVCTRGSA